MADVANRRVVQIEPKRADQGQEAARIFDCLDREQVILLGDPGAGKTHCFRKMAAAEQAPIYSVQRFVARNGDEQAKTVYLDGLDEYRPRTSARDSNPAITLLQILRKSGSPRLRLSCRFADWLGSTDLELFRDYCGTGGYAVVALEPLDQQEALEILADKGVPKPETFWAEATARHMEWMVTNPQNLLMLAEVVAHSGWPATKRDLYEQWSLRHLAEHKESLHESQLGRYASADLVDPAGAACAALLISDATGIQRGPSSDDQVPSYRSVPCSNQESVLAALSRSAFSSVEPNVATYVHRTIAEYLGARWLGKRVAEGLPLSRIQALLGVDRYPSPSLRGLHAWLPLFVPLQATALIARDPGGVLAYGDAASLPPSQKADLIKSLGTLAAENPWFLTESLSDYGLAGLSCPETAEQLVAILRSSADVPLKTLVLRAISVGELLASYRPQLEHTLADPAASPSHRRLAFKSLLRYGPDGIASVIRIYTAVLARENQSIGLRSAIVGTLYGRPFGPSDVVAILNDAATESRSRVVGELWPLDRGIPAHSLLEVLEEYQRRSLHWRASSKGSPNFEVPVSVERMVGRLCEEIPEDSVDRVDRLLKVLNGIYEKDLGTTGGSARLDQILSRRQHLSRMLVDSAVRHIAEFKHPGAVGFTLNHLSHGAIKIELVAERLCAEFDGQGGGVSFSPDMLQKYEALGKCLYSSGPESSSVFERFIEIGRSHPECKALLEAYTRCEIDERRLRPSPFAVGVAEYRIRLRQKVESEALALQRGENIGVQGELAKVYWGFYTGEAEHVRRKQLILAVGAPLTEAVERGFVAMVEGQPPPRLSEIADGSAANQFYGHWYAFLAGLDLLWDERQDLGGLSRDALAAGFALSLLLDTFDDDGKHSPGNAREWSRRILHERPEIAEEACTALLAELLRRKESIDSLLHRLPDRASAPWRSKLGMRLLLDYEPRNISDLQELCIMAAESGDGRQQLAVTARERVFVPSANRPTEDLLWIVVGFALVGGQFETKLAAAAVSHPEALWTIRSLTQSSVQADDRRARFDLNLQQMEFIVRTFGRVFPSTAHPVAGWGDQSGYDAAMYLGGLITAISTRSDSAAGECLARLLECQDLRSYRSWISSRLAEQRELNRRSRYERPTWQAVCVAVGGGAPANIEDLKALFLDDLVDAGRDIRHSNLDKYLIYWSGGESVSRAPRDEDYCRDRLVEYLRARLVPLGMWVEPEGHMAADKRADMVVFGPNTLKLPVEVKRDTHPELWVAAKNQLERLYTRDPNALGYGVYLVFYFGVGRGRGITPRVGGAPLPDSPEDLEEALNASVPAEHRDRITCAVIDASPPALPRSRASKPKGNDTGGKRTKRAGRSQSSSTARKGSDTKASSLTGEIKKGTAVRKAPRRPKSR